MKLRAILARRFFPRKYSEGLHRLVEEAIPAETVYRLAREGRFEHVRCGTIIRSPDKERCPDYCDYALDGQIVDTAMGTDACDNIHLRIIPLLTDKDCLGLLREEGGQEVPPSLPDKIRPGTGGAQSGFLRQKYPSGGWAVPGPKGKKIAKAPLPAMVSVSSPAARGNGPGADGEAPPAVGTAGGAGGGGSVPGPEDGTEEIPGCVITENRAGAEGGTGFPSDCMS